MIALIAGLVIGAQLVPLAIPTTVPARPAFPVTVYLVDYGRTAGLVLPAGSDRMIAYVYGNWRYYALRRQGPVAAVAAILWPTQGALGRKEIAGPPGKDTVRAGLDAEIENLYALDVEADADAYTYWTNSNHKTAAWLRELGCKVRGPAFNSLWRVRDPAAGPQEAATPPTGPSARDPRQRERRTAGHAACPGTARGSCATARRVTRAEITVEETDGWRPARVETATTRASRP